MAEKGKRCMTELDPETLAEVTRRRGEQDRSESQMIAILVRAGLVATRQPQGNPGGGTD